MRNKQPGNATERFLLTYEPSPLLSKRTSKAGEMSHDNNPLTLLVATLTAGCAGLAFTSAILSRDPTALSQFFTTANSLFNVGAGAIIGLLAGRARR